MSTITLKNVPNSLHHAFKARAKAHGRSLNREIIATLANSLHSERIDARAVGDHARAVRESLGVYIVQADLDLLKDAGRP